MFTNSKRHRDQEAGTSISVHDTSHGRIRYRRWQGWITVELADDPTAVIAVVRVPEAVGSR